MAQGKISKTTVGALVCPSGKDREFLWDAGKGSVSGFGVVAHQPKKIDLALNPSALSGSKVFVVQYRLHGRSRRYTIGEFGKLTVEQARSEAVKLLADVERGQDPVENRKKERGVLTFSEAWSRFEKEHIRKLAASTQSNYKAVANNVLIPLIGSRRLVDVTPHVLSTLHAKRQDTPAAANQIMRVFSSVWNWADKNEIKVGEKIPIRGIKLYKEEKKERFLTESELIRLGEALDLAETTGLPYEVDENGPKAKHAPKPQNRFRLVDAYAVAAIRLIALTGTRKREILDAKWEEISFEMGVLNLSKSKTGKKPVILPEAALDILKTLPRIKGNPYVIPGDVEGQPRADLKNPWDAVRAYAGLKGVRIHDLRHSFASTGVNGPVSLIVMSKLLGHKDIKTTMRYAHVYSAAAREAAEAVGETIAEAFGTARKDNVVPLPKRARTRADQGQNAKRVKRT